LIAFGPLLFVLGLFLLLTIPIWILPAGVLFIPIILMVGVGLLLFLILAGAFILQLLGIPAFSIVMLVFQIIGHFLIIPLTLVRSVVSSCVTFFRSFGEARIETSEVIT
jgi:hypothetical protein